MFNIKIHTLLGEGGKSAGGVKNIEVLAMKKSSDAVLLRLLFNEER